MVSDNHEELIISRPKNKSIVVLSLDDYESLKESNYLLQSPKNAERLNESLKQFEEGNLVKKQVQL